MIRDNPLVSVIIPTIDGREKYLDRAINSVKQQSYRNIELIVINENKEANVQRNIGINQSNGVYICFLDDDDEFKPDKIERQVSFMEEHKSCCLSTHFALDNRREPRIMKCKKVISYKDLLNGYCICGTPSLMVRRNVLDKLKDVYGFYFDEEFITDQEYDFVLRIVKLFKQYDCVMGLQEVLCVYYRSGNQKSFDFKKKIMGDMIFIRKHFLELTFVNKVKRIVLLFLFFSGFIFGYRLIDLYFDKQRG